MKITAELSSLQYAVDTAMRLAPPVSGNLTFTSKNGVLTVHSAAELSRCSVVVACEVSASGEFAVPAQALKDAIKGRTQLELVYANSTLSVKSGKYKTELVTVDVIPFDDIEKSSTKDWKISAEIADWIRNTIKVVALKPTLILSSWMPLGVHLNSKGAFVCCYDIQHMNWVNSKEVTGDFQCVLPLDTMSAIMDVFSKASFTMQQASSYIRVKNKLVDAYMSVPDMAEIIPVEQVREKVKEAAAAKGKVFTMSRDDVLAFMDNAKAIIGKERAELAVEADAGIRMVVRTGLGTSKTALKGAGKGDFKVDYEYFQELIAKAPAEVSVTVVDKAYLAVKLSNSSALVALNQ